MRALLVSGRFPTTYWGFQFGNYFRQGAGGQERVKPRNALLEDPLRYNWNSPILLSEHNPDVLYFGANKLFRSMDQGESWTALSDDLSLHQELPRTLLGCQAKRRWLAHCRRASRASAFGLRGTALSLDAPCGAMIQFTLLPIRHCRIGLS